jgi:hypothetical protein
VDAVEQVRAGHDVRVAQVTIDVEDTTATASFRAAAPGYTIEHGDDDGSAKLFPGRGDVAAGIVCWRTRGQRILRARRRAAPPLVRDRVKRPVNARVATQVRRLT